MAEISPFPALRYAPERVRLRDVVTQPYDKITLEMQERYYKASPYNLVRVILGRPEGPETETNNRYTQAAKYLRDWREQGVVAQDSSPSIYAYSQRFIVPGSEQKVERRGFIAAGRVYDYQDKVVFRHEQTLPKTKSDRLNLLRATHAHFGQIFMLYSDPAQTIDNLLFDDDRYAWLEVTDEYGVVHRCRRVTEPSVLNIVKTEMTDRKLIIADGHHRYETALNFSKEVRTPGGDAKLIENARSAMMTFINMDSPGLVILPTHRIVYGLRNFDAGDFKRRAGEFYELKPLDPANAPELLRSLADAGSKTNSFVAVMKSGVLLLSAKPHTSDRLPTEFSPRQRRLDVVHLHSILLDKLLGVTPEQVTNQQYIRYLRDAGEALAMVNKDAEVNVAFLMNPVSIEQVREIAFAGEVLPQKSTDFYPKLLSGLTMYSLDGVQ